MSHLYRMEPIEDNSVRLYLADKPFESIVIKPPMTVSQADLIKVGNLFLTASEALRQREDYATDPKAIEHPAAKPALTQSQDEIISIGYTNPRAFV